MTLGIVDVLHRVYCLGQEMYPARTANHFKHRASMLGVALLRFRQIRNWYEIQDNAWLRLAIKRLPLMHGVIYWPYINHNWPLARRLATIDEHYRMLDGPARIIARTISEDVDVARCDEEYAGLRLVLDKAAWFVREGEVLLNLFVGEERYYSVAFTLAIDDAQPLILVGAVQGSNAENTSTVYRDMTRALHGMRPRDLLMFALKVLGGQLGIRRIWAISNADRQHNSPYFFVLRKDKIHADYERIWLEHRGRPLGNGFFEIPVDVRHKPMDEIASRKRGLYRRRYRMLDRVAADIESACAGTSAAPANIMRQQACSQRLAA